MADLPEVPTWEPGIRQLETTDDVQGGPDGVSNTQAKQLGNRTAYLKEIADDVLAAHGTAVSLTARLNDTDDLIEQVSGLANIAALDLYR